MSQNPPLKTTPLCKAHEELGARMVPFAGWYMPIQYAGVVQEHLCVRDGVGIFDVSHMGEIDISGKDAKKFLQTLVTNDVEKLSERAILYTLMCYENGGVVDDLLVHRLAEDHYFLCVNASNADKDYQWVLDRARPFQVEARNIGAETVQLAIQGKHSEPLLQRLSDVPLDDIKYYHFKTGKIHRVDCIIARTGYTGEDGFEIYFNAEHAERVFGKLIEEGRDFSLQPIGLGARDTLRLEMGYALYGNEIGAGSSPLEAGLGWVIKLQKPAEFAGREALRRQKEAGLKRKLAGIKLLDRGVPRSHYRILREGHPVGEITSGTFSPSLNCGIAMCYVSSECAEKGTRLEVEIRSQRVPAEVVPLPFVPSRVKK
ncbi:MAG: glycine cleavage system aminomethyltransferase GcvT [Nitrospinae bacterium]|nr:glycine cleavage system aminomethyltransferase GcvT [Nitrospinota bacterium]